MLVGRDGSEEGLEAFYPVQWEFNGLAHGVKQPAQDNLSGDPGTVALLKLLRRVGFLPAGLVRGCQGA